LLYRTTLSWADEYRAGSGSDRGLRRVALIVIAKSTK
jgi:hypothetical protein